MSQDKEQPFHLWIVIVMNTILHVFTKVGVNEVKKALVINDNIEYAPHQSHLKHVQTLWHDILIAWLKFVDSANTYLNSIKNN